LIGGGLGRPVLGAAAGAHDGEVAGAADGCNRGWGGVPCDRECVAELRALVNWSDNHWEGGNRAHRSDGEARRRLLKLLGEWQRSWVELVWRGRSLVKRPDPLGLKCDTITSPRRLVNTFIHQMISDMLKRGKPIKVAINFKSWSTTWDISSEWG
jgi:hypothetical protein